MIIPAAMFNKNSNMNVPPFKQKERNDNIFILTYLNFVFVLNKFQYCILKMSILLCWKKIKQICKNVRKIL